MALFNVDYYKPTPEFKKFLTEKNKQQYQVNKSKLIERIAELVYEVRVLDTTPLAGAAPHAATASTNPATESNPATTKPR